MPGSESSSDELSGSNAQIDNSQTVDWRAPVGLVDLSNTGCTGTLVAPTLVLTAAHCFDGEPQGQGTFILPNGAPALGAPPNWSAPIVQLSTWKTWRLRPRDGLAPNDRHFVVDDDYLYVAGTPDPTLKHFEVVKLTRFPLTQLDAVGESIGP